MRDELTPGAADRRFCHGTDGSRVLHFLVGKIERVPEKG
jgi:hypothetical protein